jgi:hypothetical protein
MLKDVNMCFGMGQEIKSFPLNVSTFIYVLLTIHILYITW